MTSLPEEPGPFSHEIARLLGGGVYIGHSYGCHYPGGGGMCTCSPPSRGFDYGLMVARLAEGYYDHEGGNDGDLG